MALNKFQVQIYAELGDKNILNFVTLRRTIQFPLGGVIKAQKFVFANGAESPNRLQIIRTDAFNKNGTPKVLYRRLRQGNVVDKDENLVIAQRGSLQGVIDYINEQANLTSGGNLEFQFDGTSVGSASTVNFVGLSTLTISAGIASATISNSGGGTIGIATAGGLVGTGVTQLDFRGAGLSTITTPSNGISTINVRGGGVASGAVTGTGDTTLTLTLNDGTTVNIDASNFANYANPVTINEFQWFQQYASPGAGSATTGPRLTTNTPHISLNPFFYGTQLKPYQEMVWTHNVTTSGGGGPTIGIWDGSLTYNTNTSQKAENFDRSIAFMDDFVDNRGEDYDSSGFDFAGLTTVGLTNNVTQLALRYRGNDNKLELRNHTTGVAIATATVAQDGNPVTISCAKVTDQTLPGISTVQYYQDPGNGFKYLNSQEYLGSNDHDINGGVTFYDQKLKR